MPEEKVIFNESFAYLVDAKAAVTITNSSNIFEVSDVSPIPVKASNTGKKEHEVIPWGENNDLPQELQDKVYKSPDMTSGLKFNIEMGCGEGIMPCKFETEEDIRKVVPVLDNLVINTFLEENQINPMYLLEQITDMNWFYNVFPEIILSKDGKKIVELNSKEASFSRWTKMNEKTGLIENHLYSAKWADGSSIEEKYITQTPVLNPKRPLYDLRERIANGDKNRRFIIPVSFPTPGRSYYQKPYWYSIIESGWYDFAISIPEFKKSLIKNQMVLKYHVQIHPDYWKAIFDKEGITDEKKRKTRVKQEYDNLNDYLTGEKNAGKAWISPFDYQQPEMKEKQYIKIEVLEGGEYLEDSSEVSNMIAYSLGVHSSLIGSSPGRN